MKLLKLRDFCIVESHIGAVKFTMGYVEIYATELIAHIAITPDEEKSLKSSMSKWKIGEDLYINPKQIVAVQELPRAVRLRVGNISIRLSKEDEINAVRAMIGE